MEPEVSDLFVTVSCTYCQEEINGLRVQCCECTDFDICLQCFASGAEIGSHRSDHSYKFVDCYATSIFGGKSNWTGREQLQLLEAMELYGFGSWDLVSQYVETRTAEEVKEEYITRYLEGNIGKATWAEVQNCRPMPFEHTPDDRGPLSPEVTSRLPPLDITPEEALELRYMSYRDDYDQEYDMEAEQLVSSIELNTLEDSNTEIALKLAQVCMYTRRLRERARRKRVVRDYQLVAKFFANQRKDTNKKPLTKEQREFRDKMRVFSQFLTAGEHDRLISSIEREQELRFRISELLRYRSLGLTTQDEAIHYEQHAAYERQQQLRSKAGSSGCAASTPESPLKNGQDATDPNCTERRRMDPADEDSCRGSSWCSSSSSSNCPDSAGPPPITELPHGNLLSSDEIKLCLALKLEPVEYTTMKTLIIQDCVVSNSKLKLPSADSSDLSVKDIVMRYLCTSGWLPGVTV